MSAWTNHWSPGRQIYRWSPRSCKERQGKPPSTNSNRGVPQDRRWRTNSARPCENPLIQVARENLYYRVVVAVAAPCISWNNHSPNVYWLIAFISGHDCVIRRTLFRHCTCKFACQCEWLRYRKYRMLAVTGKGPYNFVYIIWFR